MGSRAELILRYEWSRWCGLGGARKCVYRGKMWVSVTSTAVCRAAAPHTTTQMPCAWNAMRRAAPGVVCCCGPGKFWEGACALSVNVQIAAGGWAWMGASLKPRFVDPPQLPQGLQQIHQGSADHWGGGRVFPVASMSDLCL